MQFMHADMRTDRTDRRAELYTMHMYTNFELPIGFPPKYCLAILTALKMHRLMRLMPNQPNNA